MMLPANGTVFTYPVDHLPAAPYRRLEGVGR
jgi:hypothetical protein